MARTAVGTVLAAIRGAKGVSAQAATPQVNTPADIPAGLVAVGALRMELAQLRRLAADGLAKVEAQLRVTDDPDAADLADVVMRLGADLPAEMDAVLGRLATAVEARNLEKVKAEKSAVRAATKGWMAFLAANADPIAACEANPWNVPVRIARPISDSLKAILKVASV